MCEQYTRSIAVMKTVREADSKFCAGSLLKFGDRTNVAAGICKGDSGGGLFCWDEDSERYGDGLKKEN